MISGIFHHFHLSGLMLVVFARQITINYVASKIVSSNHYRHNMVISLS